MDKNRGEKIVCNKKHQKNPSIFIIFAKTGFTLKSVHFLLSQLQHRIKSWNYVLEFKCSQNIRHQIPVLRTFLLSKLWRFFQNAVHSHSHTLLETLGMDLKSNSNFGGECLPFPHKLNIMKPFSFLCFK